MQGRENRQNKQTDRQTDRGELCREERIGRIDRQIDRQRRVMQGRENRQKRQTDRQTDRQGRVMQGRENRQNRQTEESYAGKRE